MRGLLPSVWLVGATLYTASILSLTKPFSSEDYWPAPPPINETVVAKRPLAVALQTAVPGGASLVLAAAVVPKPKVAPRDEWVQVAGYTTMVRSRPSAEAPPLYAYAVGRPLRVIAREGGFVRVQDLGSGQLGWIEEVSLVPFFPGYHQREPMPAPQVVAETAAPAPASATPVEAVQPPVPPVAAATPKKPRHPRNEVLAAKPGKETVAAVEPAARGLFGRKRAVQRVALGGRESGFAGMINKAFGGF